MDSTCPSTPPFGLHTLETGKTIESFGASEQGFTYKEGGSYLYVTKTPLLSSTKEITLQGPAGASSPRIFVSGQQAYTTAGNSLVGFSLTGAMNCSADGTLTPMAFVAGCGAQEAQNLLAATSGGGHLAVSVPCGVQVIAKKTDCKGEVIWVQYTGAESGPLGQGTDVRGFATDGSSVVWSLERPLDGEPLQLRRKVYDFSVTNAYKEATSLASLEDANELLQDAQKLYTIRHDASADTFAIVRYDASKPGAPEVLAEGLKDARQLAVRGGSIFWVESGFSTHRIWAQTGTSRKVIACSPSPIGGLTITQSAAVWHAQDTTDQLTKIQAVELP